MSLATKLESYLVGLAKRRKNRRVSADDAHRFLDREGVNGERKRLIHDVFNKDTNTFFQNGEIRSSRPVAKGRKIISWELVA